MEIKELQDKLNRKHVKVKMPKIRAEAYAATYAKMLKDFTGSIVDDFSSLVMAIFEETKIDTAALVSDNESSIVIDAAGDFEFWDKFLEENKKEIRKNAGKKGREANPWKEMLKIIGAEIDAKYPRNKKEPVDFTSTLSSLFDYYSAKAELLTKNWSDEELSNLYRYVYGSYKKEFPNLSISGEYYERIMQAVVSENLALIKSIPEHVLKDMQITLSQGIISGNQKELIKSLKRIKGVSRDRAVFIARDQVHKATESFKQVQNTALGIEYYEFNT